MNADVIGNDKLDAGQPYSCVGDRSQMKGLAGIAQDQHHFSVGLWEFARFNLLDFKWNTPVIDVSFAAFRAADRYISTCGQNPRRVARSHDAGNSEFTRNDGGMRRPSTLIRNDSRYTAHHRLPVRIRVLRDQDFPRLNLLQLAHIRHDASAPCTDLFPNSLSNHKRRPGF